jgi:hypothetical protein
LVSLKEILLSRKIPFGDGNRLSLIHASIPLVSLKEISFPRQIPFGDGNRLSLIHASIALVSLKEILLPRKISFGDGKGEGKPSGREDTEKVNEGLHGCCLLDSSYRLERVFDRTNEGTTRIEECSKHAKCERKGN